MFANQFLIWKTNTQRYYWRMVKTEGCVHQSTSSEFLVFCLFCFVFKGGHQVQLESLHAWIKLAGYMYEQSWLVTCMNEAGWLHAWMKLHESSWLLVCTRCSRNRYMHEWSWLVTCMNEAGWLHVWMKLAAGVHQESLHAWMKLAATWKKVKEAHYRRTKPKKHNGPFE